MRNVTIALWIALLACSKGKEQAKPAAEPGSGSGSAAVAPPAADAAVAKSAEPFLPAKLGDKDGVIFAETPGGSVEGIPDGTRVSLGAEKEIGVGAAEEATVTVKHSGKDVELKAERVIREGELKRSADGKYAVFAPMVACGDLCHSVLWIVSADGKRAKLGDGGVDTYVAWQPSGGTVAVGNGALYVVSLADLKVTTNNKYMSPAYAPDGTLYVRDSDGSAFKLDGDKATRVWKAKRKPAGGEEEMASEDPPPITFKDGKPKFELAF